MFGTVKPKRDVNFLTGYSFATYLRQLLVVPSCFKRALNSRSTLLGYSLYNSHNAI